MNQLTPLQILQNLASRSTLIPQDKSASNTEIAIGQIRSITFENVDQELDRRFVLVTSMTSSQSMILQVMLVGADPNLSGRNDVLLLESERPSPFDNVIQTDLKFPVLKADLGACFSHLETSTVGLLSNMANYSGRDISRSGVHRNELDLIRQDYLRDELETVRLLSRNAFLAMQGPEYKAEQVKLLNAGRHSLTIREITQPSGTYKPLPQIARQGRSETPSRQEELQFLRQLKSNRAMKEMVAA
jgi:hypothetical protein